MAGDSKEAAFQLPEQPDSFAVFRGDVDCAAQSVAFAGDHTYRVICWTFCGREQATVDLALSRDMPMLQFVRRARVVASIQHAKQNRCQYCVPVMQHRLSPEERAWVYAANPTLGKILGLDA